jgi:hypothetical protein
MAGAWVLQIGEKISGSKLDHALLIGCERSALHQQRLNGFADADEFLYFWTKVKHVDLQVYLLSGITKPLQTRFMSTATLFATLCRISTRRQRQAAPEDLEGLQIREVCGELQTIQ